ncbi:hypothetical protein CYMTET_17154 [Cymbomonas tetramitiformis]|uniref:Nucleotide-diphospho-sugar transferase domain-containing protein n=1 Tax=Cymbomonas tetramitiformis TaxID=36881 RepID=A0AAE0L7K7_9CHLO|nr:hypothetical protein CYMTET_17154 [Cymbomonas tetramitiformis]
MQGAAEYTQDSFKWNKPDPPFEYTPLGTKKSTAPGPQQIALNETREARHAVIGPKIRAIAAEHNNAVVVLMVNYDQIPLLLNFLCQCDKKFLPCREMIFVFSLDSEAQEVLDSLGLPSYHYENTNNVQGYATSGNEIVFWENAVVYDTLLLGVDVLIHDNDIVWNANPLPLLQDESRAHVDMQFMTDRFTKKQKPLYFNAGFIYNRYNDRTVEFWRQAVMESGIDKENADRQQPILMPILLNHYFTRNLRLWILPDKFTIGNLFDDIANPELPLASEWIVAHATGTKSVEEKIAKFDIIDAWHGDCIETLRNETVSQIN